MKRLSEILGLPVVDVADGSPVGHVWDVRIKRPSGDSIDHGSERWAVTGLVVGRNGALRRIGLILSSPAKRRGGWTRRDGVIDWNDIVELRMDRIVVRLRR
jgi:sporulation protein YlmC with PRC-barrel domain